LPVQKRGTCAPELDSGLDTQQDTAKIIYLRRTS
jgi:hypothetical protein